MSTLREAQHCKMLQVCVGNGWMCPFYVMPLTESDQPYYFNAAISVLDFDMQKMHKIRQSVCSVPHT